MFICPVCRKGRCVSKKGSREPRVILCSPVWCSCKHTGSQLTKHAISMTPNADAADQEMLAWFSALVRAGEWEPLRILYRG